MATDGVVRQPENFVEEAPKCQRCGLSSIVAYGLGLAAVAVTCSATTTQVLC